MGGIIDGNRWIAARLAFLRQRLSEDPTQDERKAIEAEIEALSKEHGIRAGGRRVPRLFRRIPRKR